LFKDDAVGKMRFIYEAFEDENTLRQDAEDVLKSEDGSRHLVRTLNNFTSIPHGPAMRFAKIIYDIMRTQWDILTHVQKCQQLLDAISNSYNGSSEWLDIETESLLDTPELKNDASASIILWSAWVGANLRSSHDSKKLINRQAPRRPKLLSKPLFNQLVNTMNDPEERWEYRAAAMYALVGSNAMKLNDARRFIESAYTSFPLESLAGIESLSMALEVDDLAFAEQDMISKKLSQIRKEHLYIKDMKADDFNHAAIELLKNQNNIPLEAIDVAAQLSSLDKNDRIMATILIDDTRKEEFIQKAVKLKTLRQLAKVFFENFDSDNTLCIMLSVSFVMALTEIENFNAALAETWLSACDNHDTDTLKTLAPQFATSL
jgi:hypothetical protein